MDINGKPMLEHIINRVKECQLVGDIVVAIPNLPLDKVAIGGLAKRVGVNYYAGSHHNVLDRYYKAATKFGADVIVRITGDCPLIDPRIVDKAIEYLNNYDYVSTVGTYPDGLDTEVFNYKTLRITRLNATNNLDMEHVTSYIRRNMTRFKVSYVPSGQDFSSYKLSVDTIEDLQFVRSVYQKLGDKFYLKDILKLIKGG